MKNRLLSVATALAAMTGAPGNAADTPAPAATNDQDPSANAVFVDPDSPEAKPYRDVGERGLDRFGVTLMSDASRAMRDGPVDALPQCHLKGIPMKDGTVGGVTRVAAVKLTGLKLRNPANAPDAAEKAALVAIQAGLDQGNPPNLLIQRVDLPGDRHEWRMYRPLAILRQCAVCHGPPENQPADLRAALQAKYPSDQSSGYQPGEWCGVIRITLADPAPLKSGPVSPPRKVSP